MVQHLRWIMQKDLLGQDVFLIGPPGPLRRSIAMQYLVSIEYHLCLNVCFHQDTSFRTFLCTPRKTSQTACQSEVSSLMGHLTTLLKLYEGLNI